MRVTKHEGPDGVQDGYILDIVRDGRSISQIGVLFDGEVSQIERFCARCNHRDGCQNLDAWHRAPAASRSAQV